MKMYRLSSVDKTFKYVNLTFKNAAWTNTVVCVAVRAFDYVRRNGLYIKDTTVDEITCGAI